MVNSPVMKREPVDYIQRTREQYDGLGYPPYEWVRIDDPPPFIPVRKALTHSRVGLIASGGIYRHGQVGFTYKDDISFRVIPTRTPGKHLRVTHFAYDLADARQDPNVVFPIQTLRDLARCNRIGELADDAYTFMGGIYSARKVRDTLAPALADRMQKDKVDVVILVPV
ncbi:MAG: glycine/sarcosine/betaine reductase selenoprotein B family protein [Gammaproteobacteria bacterium]|nr:glycine/sarcosine/betaine reductase selenoprotein B family protein [Gammaproteobacteria bacterium]